MHACTRLRALITIAALLLFASSARAQVTTDLLTRRAGPPTPAELQQQRLQQLLSDTGLATHPIQAAAAPVGANASSIAFPDISQTIPTTTEPKKLSSSIQILLLLSLLTLAPSILLMTTCFTRIIIVMSLLRQALGANQLPPNQILIGLSLFMTFLVMGPTWSRINSEALQPYSNNQMSQSEAFDRSVGILREFMIKQVAAAHNEDDVYLFHHYAHPEETQEPHKWAQIATTELIPGYVMSELKVAFLMGFRIYLPFLIIDMVISSVLISIGMQLLPPVMVSLPFKLLLFVLVDGWHVVIGTLLTSFS